MKLFDVQIGMENLIFIGIGILFFIEQIIYWFLGSYPYRYGILLRTIDIPNSSVIQRKEKISVDRLAIKKNDKKMEAYVRYKYPPATIGPLIFVGQFKYNEDKLKIRIGYITAIFILYLITFSIISEGLYGCLNGFIMIILTIWFYFRLKNEVQRPIKKIDCHDD
jgi:hypothetical protein